MDVKLNIKTKNIIIIDWNLYPGTAYAINDVILDFVVCILLILTFGRLQWGRSQVRLNTDKGGAKVGNILRTFFMDDPYAGHIKPI